MVFDIRVFTPGSDFWVDATDIPDCLGGNLKCIPIYAQGTFDELLSLNSKIDSAIPELFGFPKLEKNMIEGFVLKPNRSLKFANNERVILKKKNKEFLEAATAPNPNKKSEFNTGDPEPYINALQGYLNINRIESAISKFPDLKDRYKLRAQIVKDIVSETTKDGLKQAEGQLKKIVKVQFEKRVMNALNEYLRKGK